jgi:hypothetical protein
MEMTMNSTNENSQPAIRVLADEELGVVAGGFYNDNGCTNWPHDLSGRIIVPQGQNPWLTWGSPQRGGR